MLMNILLISNDQFNVPVLEYLTVLFGKAIIRNDGINLIQTRKMGDADLAKLGRVSDQNDLAGGLDHLPLDICLEIEIRC